MPRQDDLRKQIIEHRRRLQILKEKQARMGINTPPEDIIEIQDIEAEIEKLESELNELEKKQKDVDSLPPKEGTQQKSPQKITIKEKLFEIARDPMWQAIGVVITVLALAWSIYSYFNENINTPTVSLLSTPTFKSVFSPTLTPTPTVRSVTAISTDTPTPELPTPTNTPLPPTETPSPTPSPSITPTPTATPIPRPTSECKADTIEDNFKQVLIQNPELAQNLGSPSGRPPDCKWGAYEAFENGFMIWDGDSLSGDI